MNILDNFTFCGLMVYMLLHYDCESIQRFRIVLLQGVTPKMLEFMRNLRKVFDSFPFWAALLCSVELEAYILLSNPRETNPVEEN